MSPLVIHIASSGPAKTTKIIRLRRRPSPASRVGTKNRKKWRKAPGTK